MSNDIKIKQPVWKDAFSKKKMVPKNQESIDVKISGHIKIVDDLGNTILDKNNAVHPQNMSRIICRALSNESNGSIFKVAFGRGGTTVVANTIIYKPPFTGAGPTGWNDKLYDQTYYEIVDETNVGFASGPGAYPLGDPNPISTDVGVRSAEVGVLSQIAVKVVLNAQEPSGQLSTDVNAINSEGDFVFDEIGLFSSGLPLNATQGYQDVNVGNKILTDDTGLSQSIGYTFFIAGDFSPNTLITIASGAGSGVAGAILFSDLKTRINNVLPTGVAVDIQGANTDPLLPPDSTYGFLRFSSTLTGSTSNVILTANPGSTNLFTDLSGGSILESPVSGQNAGVANNSVTPALEGERLLSHAIFHPILKSANRTWTLIYTLKVSVI